MSINACAAAVKTGDPDRFLAVMAAPPEARRVLFPIFAYNLEVARAPYVTAEPMLAEIRLQWWRDALEEIRTGAPPRRHDVVGPLAEILDHETCETLTRIADARRWDIAGEPFLSAAQFRAHLDATSGNLLWAAAFLLGATDQAALRKVAFADGLSRWFQAVPEMRARGMAPLVDDSDDVIRALADSALKDMQSVRLSKPARLASLCAADAPTILKAAMATPSKVREGGLAVSEFGKRWRRMVAALR